MDYFDLLHEANKNKRRSEAKSDVRCYSTSFAPPKKVARSSVSSDNIKKFLARKEEEEKRKAMEAKKKKDELLALRALDKKAQKRVQVMLKTTKSANKSVMEDAIDNVNTADTLGGAQQCDEDDYGYVSQEASALYEKILNKYKDIPSETKAFTREVKDLNAAKDRVRAALKREAEEELLPHKRKRKKHDGENSKNENNDDEGSSAPQESEQSKKEKSAESVKKPPKKPKGPPPVDFFQLMKLAEQKQYEPIVIEKKLEVEPERPLTMKEKMERQRELERKNRKQNPSSQSVTKAKPEPDERPLPAKADPKKKELKFVKFKESPKESNGKPDVNSNILRAELKKELKSLTNTSKSVLDNKKLLDTKPSIENAQRKQVVNQRTDKGFKPAPKPNGSLHPERTQKVVDKQSNKDSNSNSNSSDSGKNVNSKMSDIDKEIELLLKKKAEMMMLQAEVNKKAESLVESGVLKKGEPSVKKNCIRNNVQGTNSEPKKETVKPPRIDPLRNKLPAERPNPVKTSKPTNKLERIENVPSNRLPSSARPKDSLPSRPPPRPYMDKRPKLKKRVIDSESDYDSELDDFIDDGPVDDMDYSRHIKEIFGYDKSRYAGVEEDECEESNFKTQMIEEKRSAKIGLLEDLADIQREKEEKERAKKRKMVKKR